MLNLALALLVTTAPPAVSAATPTTTTTTTTTTTPTTSATKPAMAPVNDKDYESTILAPRKGKVVVVNFWASYCLPCLEEIPALQALARDYASTVDVVFVSSDPPAEAAHALAVLQRRNIDIISFIVSNEDPAPFISMIDRNWQGDMPYTVIYDRKSALVQKLPGAHSKAAFQAAIDAALLTTKKP